MVAFVVLLGVVFAPVDYFFSSGLYPEAWIAPIVLGVAMSIYLAFGNKQPVSRKRKLVGAAILLSIFAASAAVTYLP